MMSSPSMELQVEEAPLALRRLWNLTRARLAGTSTALDEEPALVETLPSAQELDVTPKSCIPVPSDYESDGEEAFPELELHEKSEITTRPLWVDSAYEKEVLLDASTLGDVPAVYRVPAPAPHQMPVIGVYIDPRVRTGFRYKIRPMQAMVCGSSSFSDLRPERRSQYKPQERSLRPDGRTDILAGSM